MVDVVLELQDEECKDGCDQLGQEDQDDPLDGEEGEEGGGGDWQGRGGARGVDKAAWVPIRLPVEHPAWFAEHNKLCELGPQTKLLFGGNVQISPVFLLSHLWMLLQGELDLRFCEMSLAKFSPNTLLLYNQTHHRGRFPCTVKI